MVWSRADCFLYLHLALSKVTQDLVIRNISRHII